MFSKLFLLPKPILLCLFLKDFGQVLADTIPYFNDQKFENGDYGSYPVQTFFSSNVVAPHLNILSTHSRCDDGSYIMLNPRGNAVADDARGPMILDSLGNLVWAVTGYEQTYDLMVQEYKGQQYLTFWAGDDTVGGHGAGHYYMFDSTYKEVARISAASGMAGDLHEFRFTEDGTALLTIYDVHPADLTALGRSRNGYIWDSLFQEIDIETGELIFQWRASEHYNLTDSYHAVDGRGSRNDPWDFFHINSVEKDTWGNYLISSRYMRTITYINGTSGSTIWVLGGRRNEFTDLSEGRATDFAYQHDARWHDNYTTISLFNNGAEAPNRKENAQFSRAMKVAIDTGNMTATLVSQYINSQQILSSSQGSMQILPNGDVLVGYGYNAAFTEFAPNGIVLCDTHFGAASRFHSGDVQSYRVMKFNWTGNPTTKPSMVILDNVAYVSWNGATEVHQWVIETGEFNDEDDDAWQPVISATKTGFETKIELSQNLGPYIRVAAVDKEGGVIEVTDAFEYEQTQLFDELQLNGSDTRPLMFLICFVVFMSLSMGVGWAVNAARRTWGYLPVALEV